MRISTAKFAALVCAVGLSTQAGAVVVSWTDWTATTAGAPGAVGVLQAGGSNVNVTYSGTYSFVQTDSGTDWWNEPNPASLPYTGGEVENAPPPPDIIALGAGGPKTITFSQAIQDPYIALVSWNGNTVDFGNDVFEIVSEGEGHWGSGTIIPNATFTGFFGSGEVHGIIKFLGSYTSLSFTDTSEGWHGFTIGVAGLADDGNGNGGVPAPATLALLGLGLAGLGYHQRRRG